MKHFFLLFILASCATHKVPPPESGRWQFDERLTYQSLYDRSGGLKPVETIDGDLYVGTRYEFHFNRKYFDFDKNVLVVIGFLDNDEYETEKAVPIEVIERNFDYLKISYIISYGEPTKVKMYKTEGCYYIENGDGFNEYYCNTESGI